MVYYNFYGVEIWIICIFNIYGLRMCVNDGCVLFVFFFQAICGEGIIVFGDGFQICFFCYVVDFVEGIYCLLMSDYYLLVNIGNLDEIIIKEVVEEVVKLVGNLDVKIIYKLLFKDDLKVWQLDIIKVWEILGWELMVSWEEGLKIIMEYFREVVKV